MLQLLEQITAVGKHRSAQDARQFRQLLVSQPEVAEEECQPDVRQHQVLQTLIRKRRAAEVGSEHQPGGRIKQCGIDNADEALTAVDGRVPLWKCSVAQSLKGVIQLRVVVAREIEGKQNAPEWRQIFKEEQIGEHQ